MTKRVSKRGQQSIANLLQHHLFRLQQRVGYLEEVCPRWGDSIEDMNVAQGQIHHLENDIEWLGRVIQGIHDGHICLKKGAFDQPIDEY